MVDVQILVSLPGPRLFLVTDLQFNNQVNIAINNTEQDAK